MDTLWVLSAPQGTICSLLASCISLRLFMLFIFSISLVDRLWVCSCLRWSLCLGFFWIKVVFPRVIHSDTCAPCKHVLISCASLLWLEGHFLNQKPCIPSWSGVFQFDIFSVVLSKQMCISAFGLSLSPSSLDKLCFFFFFFGCYLSVPNRSVSLASGCWYVLVASPPVFDRFFFYCFGMSCFVCIVLTFVNISLIFLLSPVHSGLFPQVVLLFFLVLLFPFCSDVFQRLSIVLLFQPVFVDFFFCVSSRIFHPGFDFFFVLFEVVPIFSQTNFAPP